MGALLIAGHNGRKDDGEQQWTDNRATMVAVDWVSGIAGFGGCSHKIVLL